MRIFIGGSLKDVQRDAGMCREFAAALGREIVRLGHVLLNGCRSSLDLEVAKSANQWLLDNNGNPDEQIVGYCLKTDTPVHNFGRIPVSELEDWNMNHPQLRVPEQIALADAAIFVAGEEGTFWAKNWAFYARKPILGVPRFGGAGEVIYYQEQGRLVASAPIVDGDYETLNQLSSDMAKYAKDVTTLAERLVISRTVFTIMPFKREFRDVFGSYKDVCKDYGFDAERTDESVSPDRIIPRIETGIRHSAFVIADVTEPSPNVFYEVGFARALGKDVILTARKGTDLPFDISDVPTIFWEIQEDLKDGLRKYFEGGKSRYGR